MSKVYVICDNDCKYEAMTKEEIIEAIAEATGYEPSDELVLSKIRELNVNGTLQFWQGTEAQFNALEIDATQYVIKIWNGVAYLVPAGVFSLPEKSVKGEHIDSAALSTSHYADKSVTKAKLASDVTAGNLGGATLDSNGKVTASQASSSVVTVTTSTTLALSHAGKMLSVNASSAVTITVPTNASVAFPNNTEIELVQYGAGAVTIAAASGVTIISLDSAKTIAGRYGCCVLKKMATNTWLLAGALE